MNTTTQTEQTDEQQQAKKPMIDLHVWAERGKGAWNWSKAKAEATLQAMFPEPQAQKVSKSSVFFAGVMQVVLWLAFAAFLGASLPHVAYFFAAFEPENNSGQVSDYWWIMSYALAIGIDLTSFLLSLNVAVKMRRATAGLRGIPKLAAAFGVMLTHWPFILALVGFSWLVNYEHAQQFHSSMLAIAETTNINLIFWQGTLAQLNPVIASAFPLLAVAYTGMSDRISDEKREQDVSNMPTNIPAEKSLTVSNTQPTNTPDMFVIVSEQNQRLDQLTLAVTQLANTVSQLALTPPAQQTVQTIDIKEVVQQVSEVTISAVTEAVSALPVAQTPAQLPEPKAQKVTNTTQRRQTKTVVTKAETPKNYEAEIKAMLVKNPELTPSEIVKQTGCSFPTAKRYLDRLTGEGVSNSVEGSVSGFSEGYVSDVSNTEPLTVSDDEQEDVTNTPGEFEAVNTNMLVDEEEEMLVD